MADGWKKLTSQGEPRDTVPQAVLLVPSRPLLTTMSVAADNAPRNTGSFLMMFGR